MSPLLKISQLAKRTGKTNRALRYYEELGILEPAQRTESGYRLYGEDSLLRLEWIDKLSEIGFSLPEIQEFLLSFQAIDSAPNVMAALQSMYREKLTEVRANIARLEKLANELDASIAYTSGCQTCSPSTEITHCKSCSVHDDQSPMLVSVLAKSL